VGASPRDKSISIRLNAGEDWVVGGKHKYYNEYPIPQRGLGQILRWQFGGGPVEPPLVPPDQLPTYQPQSVSPRNLAQPPPDQIQVTWIGHSTFLIQLDGRNILTDPIFGNCGPIPSSRLRRLAQPGVALADLPPIHDVLISHNHYDHLDAPTIGQLGGEPHFWLPSGLSPWFQKRDIWRCRELAWWQSQPLAQGWELHSVPAQHFAARSIHDRDQTHWCGWVLRRGSRAIYFAGDTGYCPVFREIGERFGGFDLAIIPIGAYRPRWIMQPIHVDPREAVQIHVDVRSRQSVACHWGTFRLTDEPPGEPPVALRMAMIERGLPAEQFRALRFGESVLI